MSDIFISYSKADHALALKLSAFLEAEGWTVWWDKSLGAADLYRDELMKQLAAARAVITIWTENSIKSDWVRAEAGRAKAEGKLIPVKTPDVAYANIPLPFGEMHTENVGSTDLIRAAVVAQLAKPLVQQSPFWQITGLFKYQVLTWIGIVGSAITLFANLSGVLDLADRIRELVAHWKEWTHAIWVWVFSWIGVEVPRQFAPIISFVVFTIILVAGVNLSARIGPASDRPQYRAIRKIGVFVLGVIVYLAALGCAVILNAVIMGVAESTQEEIGIISGLVMLVAFSTTLLGVPIGYLLYFGKERSWIMVNSVLFLFMGGCLLIVPMSDDDRSTVATLSLIFGWFALLQICWMAVILFSSLQQLTRRLGFAVLGVLLLIGLNEILQPSKVSDNSLR